MASTDGLTMLSVHAVPPTAGGAHTLPPCDNGGAMFGDGNFSAGPLSAVGPIAPWEAECTPSVDC